MAAAWLDDPDYPAYTTGRAAETLGVEQAFLRALDAAPTKPAIRPAGLPSYPYWWFGYTAAAFVGAVIALRSWRPRPDWRFPRVCSF